MIRPDYYRCGDLECFDILTWMADDEFYLMNAIKYIFRAGNKGDEAEDLEKAITCLEEGKNSGSRRYVNVRDVYKSELPDWKKILISNIVDLRMEDFDDIRKERYDALISLIEKRLEGVTKCVKEAHLKAKKGF